VIRVVIDPGVFVSALIGARGAAPDIVVRAFVDEQTSVAASPLLLDELERVLGGRSSLGTPTSGRGATASKR
jgi:predicted nucleic acid-binding protein